MAPWLRFWALWMAWGLGFVGLASAQVNVLPSHVPSDRFASEQVRARLVAHAPEGWAPGRPAWLGLVLDHEPQWHTYWRNAGDSGLPTELTWQLPPGFSTGEIEWPTPSKFPLGNLANYGYDGQVLLPVALTLPTGWTPTPLSISVRANWLACKTECIPEEAVLSLSIDPRQPLSIDGRLFETARMARPQELTPVHTRVRVTPEGLSVSTQDLPGSWQGQKLDIFTEHPNLIAHGAPWDQRWQGSTWEARLPLNEFRSEAPDRMTVVIRTAAAGGTPPSVRLNAPVEGTWPATATPGSIPPALQAALDANASNPALAGPADVPLERWLVASVGAFVGGLILNLMPCVFPVLAIKALAFSQRGASRTQRLSGVAYTVGVVASFLALGGLLLLLRATGEQLGWGFQLQSPAVVAGLAVLFTLMGLNLMGLFELSHVLPGSWAGLQARHPVVDAGLTGVLATAIASPCTAPFMGASLGLAVTLPTGQALAVFASMGLGMAAPFLLVSWFPILGRWMPRPGAWMVQFKQFMAFPMWATVVWLLWVLGQQTGIDGAMALLGWLLTLTLLIWAWQQRGLARKWLGALAALGLLSLGWSWAPVALQGLPAEALKPQALTTASLPPGEWHAWDAQRLAEARQNGQTVLVDFTAAWCVTCQYNKRATLSQPDLLTEMGRRRVLLLRADWTRRDPAVTAALNELGRSGVPTYAVYRPGRAPQVLSELPSVGDILRATQ